MITVTKLITYPLKSAQGISLPSTGFDAGGMRNDRRLMAIDEKGIFITSRHNPQLLNISVQMNADHWMLSHPEQASDCIIPFANTAGTNTSLAGQVWRDKINAIDAGEQAAEWISSILGKTSRIALWTPKSRHSGKYDLETSFADAAPLLIASEASMKQGCDWGGVPYDARRFRPNIIVDGIEAFAEDNWTHFQIGNVSFEMLDTCVRCILTTRDPDSGIAHPDKQPMKALMEKHHNEAGQPLMGINVRLTSEAVGSMISVGDEVKAL